MVVCSRASGPDPKGSSAPAVSVRKARRFAQLIRQAAFVAIVGLILGFFAAPVDAQENPSSALSTAGPSIRLSEGAVERDEDGRVLVRAIRISEPLVVDGRLDEPIYESARPFGNFIQQEPNQGEPATEKTEGWVFFDDKNVYVSLRLWMTRPEDIIADEMRRDDNGIISRNDNIGVSLDTFFDRRSGYYLNTNVMGGVRDGLLVNENRDASVAFNLVWDVKSRRFDQGWATELVIPFKSLRYPAGREQTWGMVVQRIDIKKNEISYLTPMPRSYGNSGIWMLSNGATLVGIETPGAGGSFEVKPYGLASLVTDRQATPKVSNDGNSDIGFDAKYKITKSMNADFTYNTDFAQVEADDQQLNLTRFSLFFPEKRDFFLETQGLFGFGANFGGGGGGGGGGNSSNPILFFSRQIGLSNGQDIPIVAGGRLAGRAGPYSVAGISLRTQDTPTANAPATTFSVLRVRRDFLRRSTIGLLATDRSSSIFKPGSANNLVGLDANLRFLETIEVNAYYAQSRDAGRAGDASNYSGHFRYNANTYGFDVAQLRVGEAFNPEVGYLPRPAGYVRNFMYLRYSPRPQNFWGVRQFQNTFQVDNIGSTAGVRDTLTARGNFSINWNNGDSLSSNVGFTDDRPLEAFRAIGASIAAGAYEFVDWGVNYSAGPARPLRGGVSYGRGGYYGGTKTTMGVNGRLSLTSRVQVEPSLSLNSLQMPQGDFKARLLSARTSFAVTPRMVLSALLQHSTSSHVLGSNIRFRWEYQPGSDFFLVYNDTRDTGLTGSAAALANRSIAIKFTRLIRS